MTVEAPARNLISLSWAINKYRQLPAVYKIAASGALLAAALLVPGAAIPVAVLRLGLTGLSAGSMTMGAKEYLVGRGWSERSAGLVGVVAGVAIASFGLARFFDLHLATLFAEAQAAPQFTQGVSSLAGGEHGFSAAKSLEVDYQVSMEDNRGTMKTLGMLEKKMMDGDRLCPSGLMGQYSELKAEYLADNSRLRLWITAQEQDLINGNYTDGEVRARLAAMRQILAEQDAKLMNKLTRLCELADRALAKSSIKMYGQSCA